MSGEGSPRPTGDHGRECPVYLSMLLRVWCACVLLVCACQSEYVAACDERRSYLSNFTGSSGTAVVTAREALLWTDGRYFLQAAQQLSPEWTLMKSGVTGTPSVEVTRRCCSCQQRIVLMSV